MEHKTNPGVTYVIMLPLLKFSHVNFLEMETRIFQVLVSILWDYLGDRTPDLPQISSLLYQLNDCLESGLVETVIGNRIGNTHNEWYVQNQEDDRYVNLDSPFQQNRLSDYTSKRLYDVKIMCLPPTRSFTVCNEFLAENHFLGIKKFELLWHLGRDNQNSKGFEKTLLKMLDKLSLPYHNSVRIFTTKFLQESFIRNDLPRLLRPLLKIILAQNTKKISVVHAHSLKKVELNEMSAERGTEDDEEVILGKDIYAVQSEDGNVSYSYHMNTPPGKTRSPIRSLQKKFFGVTIRSKNKATPNYTISNKSTTPVTDNNSSNISLIINPLDNSPDIVSHHQQISDTKSLSSSAPSQTPLLNEIDSIGKY